MAKILSFKRIWAYITICLLSKSSFFCLVSSFWSKILPCLKKRWESAWNPDFSWKSKFYFNFDILDDIKSLCSLKYSPLDFGLLFILRFFSLKLANLGYLLGLSKVTRHDFRDIDPQKVLDLKLATHNM